MEDQRRWKKSKFRATCFFMLKERRESEAAGENKQIPAVPTRPLQNRGRGRSNSNTIPFHFARLLQLTMAASAFPKFSLLLLLLLFFFVFFHVTPLVLSGPPDTGGCWNCAGTAPTTRSSPIPPLWLPSPKPKPKPKEKNNNKYYNKYNYLPSHPRGEGDAATAAYLQPP